MTGSFLSASEKDRYARQIIIPQIGQGGQAKLKAARVLIVGLGGLGSVAAYYLAAAGVGTLTIVDSDRVELGNLNRQILHATDDLGRPKTASALEKLQALAPSCRLRAVEKRIRDDNVDALVGDCDLIVDATDNMAARQTLNRASVSAETPFIFGGIDGFSGMASTFIPNRTACLGCLFPDPPNPAAANPVGALGPVAGLVASIQCMQAIQLILGHTPALAGRLLRIDAGKMSFRPMGITPNPHCPVCGVNKGKRGTKGRDLIEAPFHPRPSTRRNLP